MKDYSLKFLSWHKAFSDNMRPYFNHFKFYGKGFLITLLEEIQFSSNGFYIKFGETEKNFFKKYWNIKEDKFNEMFKYLLNNFFDRTLYEKFSILTSESIQENFFKANKLKEIVNVNIEYILSSFAPQIHAIELLRAGNVAELDKNVDKVEQTKQNENFVDKLVNNNINNKFNNNATASINISKYAINSMEDVKAHLSKLDETDRNKYELLYSKFNDGVVVNFDMIYDEWRLVAFKIIFALIDLLKIQNERIIIQKQEYSRADFILMIYELSPADFLRMIHRVKNYATEIKSLPFYLAGMIVKLKGVIQ